MEEADPGEKVNRRCWECRAELEEGKDFKDYRNKQLEAALKEIFPGYTNERDGITPKVRYTAPKGKPTKGKKGAMKVTKEPEKPGPKSKKRKLDS